jgi:protein required for attachment to host cells
MAISHWILTADEEVGRLLRVERTVSGHAHVAVDDEILDTWEEHQHGRPSPRSGKSGHTYASRGHEDETRRERFAKEIAVWLERRAEELHIDRIAVFAPPRFQGALRDAWSPRLAIRVDEHHGDLAHLSPGDLACHGSIVSLMSVGHT